MSRTLEEIRERVLGPDMAREDGKSALPPIGPWAEPAPLPPPDPRAPTFDVDLLPEDLRPFIRDVSERACLPADFFIPALFATLATVIGNRIRVQPKRLDDFLVVVNLWCALVAASGSMKSYAGKAVLPFLHWIEHDLQRTYEEEAFKTAGERDDLELLEAALQERRKKAAKDGKHGEIANLRAELDDIRAKLAELHVPSPRLVVMDLTPEKEVEILRDNPSQVPEPLYFRSSTTGRR